MSADVLKLDVPIMPRGMHAAWLIKLLGDDLVSNKVDLSTEEGEIHFMEMVAVFLQCVSGAVDNQDAFKGLRASYNHVTNQAQAWFDADGNDIQVTLSSDPDEVPVGMVTKQLKIQQENS